jgi:hypothetical protein
MNVSVKVLRGRVKKGGIYYGVGETIPGGLNEKTAQELKDQGLVEIVSTSPENTQNFVPAMDSANSVKPAKTANAEPDLLGLGGVGDVIPPADGTGDVIPPVGDPSDIISPAGPPSKVKNGKGKGK